MSTVIGDSQPKRNRTNEWTDRHEWRISIDWVRETAKQAQGKPIFLCGGGSNEPEVRALCKQTFWLQTDEATIRKRVALPRGHTYGTKPHELLQRLRAIPEKRLTTKRLALS